VVGAVEQISERWLLPVLEAMLEQFPFRVRGFHSDNGSEYINHRVAELLNKLLAEQTKSRPRHSNDNGLAECKNGAVVRKHMGLFRFSVKWRGSVPPIVSVPPLRGGDFQGIRVYRSDAFWGRARKATPRARHRLDEPTGLSLGMVASLQSQRPFRSAMSL
jgi:transposase InsO family protein